MATTTNQTLWGFLWWLKHNRFKSIEAMNTDDLDAMILAWTTENAAECTVTTADPAAYGDSTFPKENTAAGSGIAAAQTQAACDQSFYPEQHHAG